jgi:hypothetical protein
MLRRLGLPGVFGVLVMLAGIALIAWENLLIAGGLALTIAGLGLVVYGLVSGLLSAMGMGGMV